MNKTGFGFLRYPKLDPNDDRSVDYALLNAMVDRFLELGGDYFDTAYTYQNGINEEALRKSLVERYPREQYRIADKLPSFMVKDQEDCRRFFETSLKRCGVDYFDVYLLHGLNAENFELAERYDQFAFLQTVKAEGLAKKIGFSYHDSPELLDRILTLHPEMDYVQLQINYLDWESMSIQARRCYETARKHGKQIIVMEPVKGGSLASLPDDAAALLKKHSPDASIASWAIRFAASLPQVELVLSGMNTMAQMEDNMAPLLPLSEAEFELLEQAAGLIRASIAVGCTGCGYCVDHCPKKIPIPSLFSLYNEYARNPSENWKMQYLYNAMVKGRGDAASCIACGQCQQRCPQKLPIVSLMPKIAKAFADD